MSGVWVALAVVGGLAQLPAQIRIEARAPVAVQPTLREDAGGDPGGLGQPAQLLESPNIDRFLRKAQDFLRREDYPSAIRLLQDVIEGRTLQDPAADDVSGESVEPENADALEALAEDSRHAVFSADERLFRPVQRLCHELLAALPERGIAYYRSTYEVEAERALAAALDSGELGGLEEVHRRYFVTRAAGRALRLAGDGQLDRGRYRTAIGSYRRLLEVYPDALRLEAGIDARWLRFKIALCYQLIGDPASARAELAKLVEQHPDATLRIAGELVSMADLARDGFAASASPQRTSQPGATTVLRDAGAELVALWEHRFVDQDPYRPAVVTGDERQRFVVFNGNSLAPTPKHSEFVSGPQLTVHDGRVAFLDHYRLRELDALTGRAQAVNDGAVQVPPPQPGRPRVRIPVYDFAAQRVVPLPGLDLTAVLVGPENPRPEGMNAVTVNSLEAWRADGSSCVWRSTDSAALAEATFLAAPTAFASRLLVPALRDGTVELFCIDAADGALIYRVPLHREGTDFVRPVAVPVQVVDGVAYVLTGAGCLAAVEAHTGTVRWIRRYERLHPFREALPRSTPARSQMFGSSVFREERLPGFAPTDLIHHEGLLVFGPPDGRVLLAIDAASGEPVWMLPRGLSMVAPLGHDGEHLFVMCHDELLCVGLHTGLRLWSTEVPSHPDSARWRGRGVVAAGHVLVPGDRQIHLRGTGPDDRWRSIDLPSFRLGAEPLQGPFDLFADGPWLLASFAGGVQAFSTSDALAHHAAGVRGPLRLSAVHAQAGDLTAATATLREALRDEEPTDAATRHELAARLVAMSGDLALAMASHGAREEALATLARCRELMPDRDLVHRWHLARLEVFKTLGDADAVRAEQQQLYEVMDGRSPAPPEEDR